MTPFQVACQARWAGSPRLKPDELLARHGTFAVGGPAEVWLAAESAKDIADLARLAAEHDVPALFVGNGTNVLYADAGARGAVARVSPEDWQLVETGPDVATLTAGAGCSLPKLINDLATRGWAGLEWGAGVPGTIGGAVVSNAGAHGQSINDTLRVATVLDLHDPAAPILQDLPAGELGLDYRVSRFRSTRELRFDDASVPLPFPRERIDPVEIILGARFALRRDDPAAIRARVAHYKQHRKETQPPQPSAGSVFKNPPGDFAGRLVESVGLKGHRIGNAAISARHANFIVNLGGATAAEIIALIALARRTVLERHGIALHLEVELRGDWA